VILECWRGENLKIQRSGKVENRKSGRLKTLKVEKWVRFSG